MRQERIPHRGLVVRAWYADGHSEDVTRWAKFTSSEDLVATVDADGKVKVAGFGETAISVWFSNQVAATRLAEAGERHWRADQRVLHEVHVDEEAADERTEREQYRNAVRGEGVSVRTLVFSSEGFQPVAPMRLPAPQLLKEAAGGDGDALTDSAEGRVSFAGDCVRLDSFEGRSGAMGMRGTGTVGFDETLNLRMNAGVLEKLQDSLGGLGKAWAKMSDAVAGYRVSGTLRKPEVSLEIGGP